MPFEAISVLEKKIDALLETIHDVRAANSELQSEMAAKTQAIKALEDQNQRLSRAIEAIKGDSEENQKKLDTAAEKIQVIIAKLEAVA